MDARAFARLFDELGSAAQSYRNVGHYAIADLLEAAARNVAAAEMILDAGPDEDEQPAIGDRERFGTD